MTELSGFESQFISLFDNRGVFWVVLAIALGAGAMHAVAPGHGKSVTAAYLVGTRGSYPDALRLGVIVALMHTFSVLVLAFAWVGLKQRPSSARRASPPGCRCWPEWSPSASAST